MRTLCWTLISGICALIGGLGMTGVVNKLLLPKIPPNRFASQQVSSEKLFVIPYGEAPNQIYLKSPDGPGEGENIWAIVPATFRILPNGNLVIVGGRHKHLAAQLFDLRGQLVRFTEYEHADSLDNELIDIGVDGSLYICRRLLMLDLQHIFQTEQNRPLLNQLLFIGNLDGTTNRNLRDKLQSDLYQVIEINKFEMLGLDLVVSNTAEVFVSLCSSLQAGEPCHYQLVQLHPREEPKLLAAPPGMPAIRLYDGSIGYLQYKVSEEQQIASGVKILRADGTILAQFKIPDSIYKKGNLILGDGESPDPVLVRADRLVLLLRDDSLQSDGSRKTLATVNGIPIYPYSLVVLDSSGAVVFEESFGAIGMQRLCDTDGRGNLYYFNFMKEGVEVRRVSF
jgi:hypothetical protein